MKRVVLTGPESTGKSTLGKQMSQAFKCSLVGEFARNYIHTLDRPYIQEDLLLIAKGQINLEQNSTDNSELIICDTDLLTIKIWSEYKYGSCDLWITDQLKKNLPDLYLICYPDLKWEYDSQRENPNDGLELFDRYLSAIKTLGVPFHLIKGQGESRVNLALQSAREIIY